MIIAMVTQKLVQHDGQGRVNSVIAAELLRRGHDVLVIASEVGPELRDHPRLHWTRVPHSGVPTQLLKDQLFAWRAGRLLRDRRDEIDLVVINGFVCWSPSDVNIVHFVHSAWIRSPAHPVRKRVGPVSLYHALYNLLNVAFERWSFRGARRIVAVSRTVRNELLAAGVPLGRISVIDNGVDAAEFTPGTPDGRTLGFAEGGPVALFVGDARTNRKNLDGVLHALASVPGLNLAIVGDAEGGPFPALVDRLGLGARVRFLGHRKDVAALMRAADLFVFPTRYEPFGLVLLEAAASGLPVITTRAAGASWLLDEQGAILLDDPESVGGIASALRTITDDPELRRTMAAAARRIAESHDWSVTAARYADLIESAIPLVSPPSQRPGARALSAG
ncbi:glycosyltransferase family 4 protein [Azospirillum sp. SYSU D00513]|uniref:glycosyltransferase family 4 protein n=1 Tax=Azospirillum sp. SYSU D00513 TaxID=2812561 RepID=UPI001A965BEC|nr:glycosyltransferase family 4 protein [Azospirillum sp. SYSU D00513]